MKPFNLGDAAIITDPCYSRGTWCQGTIETKPGKWLAWVVERNMGDWGKRNCELVAVHADHYLDYPGNLKWAIMPFEIGVDSGQCGIFDDRSYPDSNINNNFYKDCCEITDKSWGIMQETGVVARSGYGDGGYDGFFAADPEDKSAQQAIALKIVFIREDEEEEEE